MSVIIVDDNDKKTIDISLKSLLNLICGDDRDYKIKLFNDFNKYVNLTIHQKENKIVNIDSPGNTSIVLDISKIIIGNVNYLEEVNVDLLKFDKNDDLSKTYTHGVCHELFHTFNAFIPHYLDNNKLVKQTNDKMYFADGGNISYITPNRKNNTFGKMIDEVLTDNLSYISLLYVDDRFKGFTANDVFNNMKKTNKFYISSYNVFMPFVNLALSSFSNEIDEDFNEIISNKKSIFTRKIKMNNGKELYSNDLLFSHLYNPLHLKKVYEDVMGEKEADKFLINMDKIFTSALDIGEMPVSNIKKFITDIKSFTYKKGEKYFNEGLFDQETLNKYLDNFNNKLSKFYEEFDIKKTKSKSLLLKDEEK